MPRRYGKTARQQLRGHAMRRLMLPPSRLDETIHTKLRKAVRQMQRGMLRELQRPASGPAGFSANCGYVEPRTTGELLVALSDFVSRRQSDFAPLTEAQYKVLEDAAPTQRGAVRSSLLSKQERE